MFWKSLEAAFQRNSLADALVYNIELVFFFLESRFLSSKIEKERKILTLLALAG
jgi:hypothetical protein